MIANVHVTIDNDTVSKPALLNAQVVATLLIHVVAAYSYYNCEIKTTSAWGWLINNLKVGYKENVMSVRQKIFSEMTEDA